MKRCIFSMVTCMLLGTMSLYAQEIPVLATLNNNYKLNWDRSAALPSVFLIEIPEAKDPYWKNPLENLTSTDLVAWKWPHEGKYLQATLDKNQRKDWTEAYWKLYVQRQLSIQLSSSK